MTARLEGGGIFEAKYILWPKKQSVCRDKLGINILIVPIQFHSIFSQLSE